MTMRAKKTNARICLAAALLLASVGASAGAPPARHLIYLHGRIIQNEQNARPVHPEHGPYELEKIVETFRARGFDVSASIRPKNATVSEAADAVVAQLRALLASGVPARRITVVGASMGAWIGMRASARLQNHDVRFAFLGPCLSVNAKAVAAEERLPLAGHVLVVRDESDVPRAGCPEWDGTGETPGLRASEISIDTGLGHGYLYHPLPEWVEPVISFAQKD